MLIVITHACYDTGGLGCLAHFIGLLQAHGQGLFAVHGFACRNRCHRHREVQVVGGGDGHQVHVGVGDQLLPVAVGLSKAPCASTVSGPFSVGIRQRRQVQFHRQLEGCTDVAKRQRMRASHKSGADQAYSK